jgi:hypothetical protein
MVSPYAGLALGITRTKVAPTRTAGESGVPIVAGRVYGGERDSRLQGISRYKTYSEILANVDIVTAGVRYYGDLVAKTDWKVEPADESGAATEFAEFVESVLHDMTTPWHRVVRRAAMYRLWGFSLQEWTAKVRDDGKLGLKDIEPRPQRTIDRWDTDETGTVFGAVQRSEVSGRDLYLPRSKLLYLVDDSIDASPEGFGLFRGIVRHATALTRLEDLEGFGFETDLRGMPVLRAPLMALRRAIETKDLTKAEVDEILAPFNEFLNSHVKNPSLGMLVDSAVYSTTNDAQTPSQVRQYDIDVVRQDAAGLEELAATIERKTRAIARILGVEFLLLGSDSKGSYALSEDKAASFGLLVDSALTEIARTAEADIVHTLALLNGVDDELEPTLVPDRARFRDVQQITGALKDLATAGAPLGVNDDAVNEVRALLGVSRAELVEELEVDAMLSERGGPGGAGTDDEDGTVVEDDVDADDEASQGSQRRRAGGRNGRASRSSRSNDRAAARTGR